MIKLMIKSIREYKKYAIITPLLMILEVLMESFIVLRSRDLVNVMGMVKPDMAMIWLNGLYLILMAVASLLCGLGGAVFGAKASAGFAKNLREDLFIKIQGFSFENIDSFQTSSLITRLTTDIQTVQMAFQMCLRIVIRCPLMLGMSIVMAFVINYELAFLYVIILPILGVAIFLVARFTMPVFRRVFKQYDRLNNSIHENVKGVRVVKSYVREEYEKEKFGKASENLYRGFRRAERIVALNNPIMQFCMQFSMFLLVFFASKIAADHHFLVFPGETNFQVGDISSLSAYGVQMLSSMMMLAMIFIMLSMSIEAGRRIAEVMNTKSNLTNPENPVMEVKNGDIIFDNVSFKYSKDAEKNVLSDINLNIKSGQTIGIIGSTGSGKTSLVNLISRLYDVTEGEIIVGGVNVKDYDLDTLRNNIAVVLQKNVLFSGTINENMRWGDKEATDEEIRQACITACADEFISQFPDKYETHIEEGGTNVSGGQKQRLCIARALLKKPKVLILDDSTSAVDTKTDLLIRKAMRENNPDITKIIIAQRVASICDADQIVVLDNGRIDAVGRHDQLMKTNKIYQEVYNSQNRVGDQNA